MLHSHAAAKQAPLARIQPTRVQTAACCMFEPAHVPCRCARRAGTLTHRTAARTHGGGTAAAPLALAPASPPPPPLRTRTCVAAAAHTATAAAKVAASRWIRFI